MNVSDKCSAAVVPVDINSSSSGCQIPDTNRPPPSVLSWAGHLFYLPNRRNCASHGPLPPHGVPITDAAGPRTMAKTTASADSPMPCRIRAAMKHSIVSALKQQREAKESSKRQVRSTGRRPMRSWGVEHVITRTANSYSETHASAVATWEQHGNN